MVSEVASLIGLGSMLGDGVFGSRSEVIKSGSAKSEFDTSGLGSKIESSDRYDSAIVITFGGSLTMRENSELLMTRSDSLESSFSTARAALSTCSRRGATSTFVSIPVRLFLRQIRQTSPSCDENSRK